MGGAVQKDSGSLVVYRQQVRESEQSTTIYEKE